jgi:hypothetical protein
MVASVSGIAQERGRLRPVEPVEPIAAILEAFRTHQVVALSEGGHGNEQSHAFRLALVRDPRFAATVDDIVVEFGNSLYQDTMNRFVQGAAIPDNELRQVWENTTQESTVWDRPIYEEFFRAVRGVNASLPRERQLRVLLGDPPVEWNDGTRSRLAMNRGAFAADLIRREVLEPGRRALVTYGGGHLWRAGPSHENLTGLLERHGPVFNVITQAASGVNLESLHPGVIDWSVPSLAKIDGTLLDANSLASWDAILYLGPPSDLTFSRLPPALCADRRYTAMRLRRLVSIPYALRDFKQYCASVGVPIP